MKLPHLTFGKILAGTAVVLIASGGTAYAAATITGVDIVDGSVGGIDVANSSIKSVDLFDSSVTTTDILNSTIGSADLANESVGSSEVVDYGLSNRDVGVLFLQATAAGSTARKSDGVAGVVRVGLGAYEVLFQRDVSICAFAVTNGPPNFSAVPIPPAVAQVSDHVELEMAMVTMTDLGGNPVDAPFQLIAVC